MVNTAQTNTPRPVVLVVMDGWGVAPDYSGNAVTQAKTPFIKDLIAKYPSMILRASGEAVGLPWGVVGNSEVGHLNLGLGRVLYQDLPRINKAIGDGGFEKNEKFLKAFAHIKKNNSKLHIFGLVSGGGIHSSIDHLYALLSIAKQNNIEKVYLHAFTDGCDTSFNSAQGFIMDVERNMQQLGVGKIATISGRFYAMDRGNNWDRTAKAYLAMTQGIGNKANSATIAIEESYKKKVYDEEFVPTVIMENDKPVGMVESGDAVIFFNYRADRARQITKAFTIPSFDQKFEGWKYLSDLLFVTFTKYEDNLPIDVAFPEDSKKNSLSEILSNHNLKQLRIAETEKYAHVTYFFNGGIESKNVGEEHCLIPSLQLSSYDDKPEMCSIQVTDKLVKYIESDEFDFILINIANADIIGHTGNMSAVIKAVETVDKCVGRIVKAVLEKKGVAIITADHGNAESMFNMQTGTIDNEHTTNPVPFILVGEQFEGRSIGFQDVPGGDLSVLMPQGMLSDVAPTILKLMNIEKPDEMTGRSLI